MISASIISDRLKVNMSVARRAMAELVRPLPHLFLSLSLSSRCSRRPTCAARAAACSPSFAAQEGPHQARCPPPNAGQCALFLLSLPPLPHPPHMLGFIGSVAALLCLVLCLFRVFGWRCVCCLRLRVIGLSCLCCCFSQPFASCLVLLHPPLVCTLGPNPLPPLPLPCLLPSLTHLSENLHPYRW
jgi:hypothetical protein